MTKWTPRTAIEALADAWASIDGKRKEFRRGRTAKSYTAYGGHYPGYMEEAKEMVKRLEARGYTVCRFVKLEEYGERLKKRKAALRMPVEG